MASEFNARRSFRTDHSSPARFVLSHIRRHWTFGITMIIGAFSNAALAALVPTFIGHAFNAIAEGQGIEAIPPVVFGLIVWQRISGVRQLMGNLSAEIFAPRLARAVPACLARA